MKKNTLFYLLLMLAFLNANSQNYNSTPPVQYPMPSSVWDFVKYGTVPVNEYRGLVNLSIPLYNIEVDNVKIPLQLTYYSGGIKVTEEAGIVGLGWNFNLPTIIQQVKDKPDFYKNVVHHRLPPFQGNPAYAQSGYFLMPNPYSGYGENLFDVVYSLPEINEIPFLTNVVNNRILDHHGSYDLRSSIGLYAQIFEPSYKTVDTEPDIFSVTINGEELKFCTEPSTREQTRYNDVTTFEILPVAIINGRTDYKVETIVSDVQFNTYEVSAVSGFKITDPNGAQYFFEKIEMARTSNIPSTFIYKLSKIVSNQNKELTFNYLPSVNVIEPGLIESRYARFTSNVSVADNHSLGGAFYTSMGQRSVIACGTGSSVDSYCEISGFNNLYQNIYYLNSITTPNETIYLSNESRLDNISKMKLKELEVKNIFNQRVKHFSFDYDYFLSGSGNTKRLKLTSITEEGNNPYLFDYNAGQLPDKNSYSIDYWGFYNGHPNTSFKPDLTDLGYPEYKENVNNDFNSKINFTKAGSLERVIYPTKGYTLFEYETHQFDNLLYSAGGNPTIINTGGGLRIKNVTNFNFDNTISEKTNYEYFGGKSISKKLLAKGVSESVFTGSGPTNTYYSSAIISNLNNYISYTSSSEPDYIGYDKVVVKKIGATNNGKVEKQYSNYENSVINPENGFNYNAFSYSKTSNIENGKVLEEKIVNSDDVLQNKTVFTYFNKIFNEGFYGMAKQSNGVGITDYVGHGTGQYVYNYYPRTLAIFYAIRGRTTFLESEVKTEYFNSNTKTITTNYKYNNNMLTSVANQEFNANFQEINVSENHTSYSFYNRPVYKSSAINNTLTNVQRFSYDKITDYNFQLKKLESFPNGNFSINKDIMYYDLYDDKNNLKQFHQENGYNTCVVWGYNKTLPIAKIENVTYSQIQPYVDAIQAASNTNNENGLLAALSTFRNTLGSLFQDVMVTTYTHIPLVGTSTITDPKGETTSYSYDSFRRLQFVKDKKGNILSENEYHYKN